MKHIGDLTNVKVAALYAGVPHAELEKFQAFCAACPYKQVTLSNMEWPYLERIPN